MELTIQHSSPVANNKVEGHHSHQAPSHHQLSPLERATGLPYLAPHPAQHSPTKPGYPSQALRSINQALSASINNTTVTNPRRWGAVDHNDSRETQTSEKKTATNDWAASPPNSVKEDNTNKVGQWVEGVPPISPPLSPAHSARNSASVPPSPRAESIDLPPRPNSAKPEARRVMVFVSDDEGSIASATLITPKDTPRKARDDNTAETAQDGILPTEEEEDNPWPIPESTDPISERRRDINRRRSSVYSQQTDTRPRQRRFDFNDAHPLHSEEFADRRLFVQ